jgi:SAM-dependent methyltransferase
MFTRSAELYDAIYRGMKDYEGESRRIRGLVAERHPRARRLLDVACGTGEHALHLGRLGYEVDGVDLDDGLLAIARRKNPGRRFVTADMTEFDLGVRYDVVLCLFSAIGYVRTRDGLRAALSRFRAHMEDDGLVVVEPWFEPGVLDPGRVFVDTAEAEGVKVARMAVTEVKDRLSFTRFEYLIGSDGGIRRESETHELGLFTTDEMLDAFRAAGLEAEHDPEGMTGRGLYVGRVAGP